MRTVAEHLKIKITENDHSDAKIENLICQKVGKNILKKMSPEQQATFIAAIERESAKYSGSSNFIGAGGIAAALVAGNVGGFGTYMLATTGLAALTGTLGITLPFAAYTGLSAALGVALGPVGWVSLGLAALFTIGGPCYDKLIPTILYVAMLRNEPKNITSSANANSSESLFRPSKELAAIIGNEPVKRADAVTKIMNYITANNLLGTDGKRTISVDSRLKPILGQSQVALYELAGLISKHMS